jgi:hypothetical protein
MFVVYEYPNDVRGFVGQRQVGDTYSENSDYLMGSEGFAKIPGWQAPMIKAKTNWRYHETGPKTDMYQVEHDELFASIRAGKPINDGESAAHSSAMAIFAREAAYSGDRLTWKKFWASEKSLAPKTYAWADNPVPGVPMPGAYKFA